MIKVAIQSSGENRNFSLNVVKTRGQPIGKKVKIVPTLFYSKHKNKLQMD